MHEQFTLWFCRCLGKDKRWFVPLCVLKVIRNMYPELDRKYVLYNKGDKDWNIVDIADLTVQREKKCWFFGTQLLQSAWYILAMPLYENLVSYFRSFKAFSSAAMFFNNLNGSESAFRQSFALTSFFVRRRWLHFLNLFPDLH